MFNGDAVDGTPAIDRTHRIRITSAAAKSGNGWLTQHPSEPAYTMTNEAMRAALHLRLGTQPLHVTTCPLCSQQRPAHDHMHWCSYLRGGVVTDRHDRIKHTLAHLARNLGCHVTIEPRDYDREHDVDARSHLLITGRHGRWMIDVSIVHPTFPSYLSSNASNDGKRGEERERVKTRKYQQLARELRYDFVPFVIESYGNWATKALAFVALSRLSSQRGKQARIGTHMRLVLSLSLCSAVTHTWRQWEHNVYALTPTTCSALHAP